MALTLLHTPNPPVDNVPMPSLKGAVRPSKGIGVLSSYLSPLWLTRLSVLEISLAFKNLGVGLLRNAACYGMPFRQCCGILHIIVALVDCNCLYVSRQALQPY